MIKKGGIRRLFTPFGITQWIMVGAVAFALWLAYFPWRWERTKDEFRGRFPAVRRIDSAGLKEWYEKRDGPKPVIIDVRPAAEYEFSHLPGALNMGLADTPAKLGFPEKTDESLVIYDAVGAESFPVASSLTQRGYLRVQVLEGGIYEWANRAWPLEGSGGAMDKVKQGEPRFAGLLKRQYRAP
jgi:rhodanese-related sulfurtransferase